MTKTNASNEDSIPQRFVFGLENGKPVGARFPTSETRILEIVKAKNLQVHQSTDDECIALGMQLPVGRVYARGKAFIPPIKLALYEELQAALGGAQADQTATVTNDAAQQASSAATVNRRWIGTPYRQPKGTPLSDGF